MISEKSLFPLLSAIICLQPSSPDEFVVNTLDLYSKATPFGGTIQFEVNKTGPLKLKNSFV